MCHLLRPLNDALQAYVLAATKIHCDDALVLVFQQGLKSTKLGQLWDYLRDDLPAGNDEAPAVWHGYKPDRAGKSTAEHLAAFRGNLQANEYAGYNALYAAARRQEATCWGMWVASSLRSIKCIPNSIVTDVLHAIAKLYALEKATKCKPPDQSVAIRQAPAGPVLDSLKTQLQTTLKWCAKKITIGQTYPLCTRALRCVAALC